MRGTPRNYFYVNNINRKNVIYKTMYHLLIPIAVTFMYYKYIDRVKCINLNKNTVFILASVHNAGLSAFSAFIFIKMSFLLHQRGIGFKSNYYFNIPEFDKLALWFYFSKYYEFMDIVLVILQKKEPVFLQKFHHIGAIFCWHLCYVYKVDAIWTANLINSLVHSIMYTYYLLSMFKIPRIKSIKMAITTLQLTQLGASIVLCPYAYYPPVETPFNYAIVIFFNIYVTILIGLFLQFSLKTYCRT
jgi:hypothetical protein